MQVNTWTKIIFVIVRRGDFFVSAALLRLSPCESFTCRGFYCANSGHTHSTTAAILWFLFRLFICPIWSRFWTEYFIAMPHTGCSHLVHSNQTFCTLNHELLLHRCQFTPIFCKIGNALRLHAHTSHLFPKVDTCGNFCIHVNVSLCFP